VSFYYKLVVNIKFRSNDSKNEVIKYLLDDERPEFEDDVPSEEVFLFELFEHADFPLLVDTKSMEVSLTYGEEDMLFKLPKLLNYFGIEVATAFVDAEDSEREYFEYNSTLVSFREKQGSQGVRHILQ